jgi:hypothetical protein
MLYSIRDFVLLISVYCPSILMWTGLILVILLSSFFMISRAVSDFIYFSSIQWLHVPVGLSK